jgi:hypothetical protein
MYLYNKGPTGCTIYFQFYYDKEPQHVSSRLTAHHQEVLFCIYSNLYTATCYAFLLAGSDPILLAASQHKRMIYTNCCIYRIVPPDEEQQACSKHVEVIYPNKTESE